MFKRNLAWLLLLVAAAAMVAAGCGGDDDDSGDEDAIAEVIEFAAASGDPAACTEAQTQAFTEQTTGKTGEAAVKQCEEDAEESADQAEVSNVEVDDDTATADVALTGGFFDGQTLSVALVQDEDEWKADELAGFADGFDLDAFTAALEEAGQQEDFPAGAVDCISENVAGLSDAELEALFIDADAELESQVFDPCFDG